MRGANLYLQPDSTKKNNPLFGDIPEEQKRLAIYIAQAKMYLLTNLDTVKLNYAAYIYNQLCIQNPIINTDVYNLGMGAMWGGSSQAHNIIKSHILLCDEVLVLCNPKDGEPSIIVDAFTFTDFNIGAFEEQMLVEYMQNHSKEDSPYSEFAKKAAIRAAKYGSGYAMNKMGNYLTKTGTRLSALSKFYASGHSSTMRIQQSFRGKKAQRDALIKMFKKSADYGKSAARSKMVGGVLQKSASKAMKGSFKLLGWTEVFTNIFDANGPAPFEPEKERMNKIIPKELEIYCKNNGNYQTIINQQYFTQE